MMPSATKSLTDAAGAFVFELAGTLAKLQSHEHQQAAYIEQLLKVMEATPPTFNGYPESPGDVPAAWQDLSNREQNSQIARLLDALVSFDSAFDWMDGQRFWPGPQHQHFSRKLWSTYLIGDQDAPFSADSQYIALLMIMGPDVLYPMHSHRIEELYFILSGQGDWSHDGLNWETLPPGSTFFNSSWQPHAISANDEPVISVGFYLPPYGWEGGLLLQPT